MQLNVEMPESRDILTRDQMPEEDYRAVTEANSARSLLVIRFAVGVVGVLLPFVLILVDFLLLGDRSCLRVRDSLSAYYHSGARDIFVIGLGIVGFLLIFYKISRRSWANGLSLAAGLAAVVVAVSPTRLPDQVAQNECGGGAVEPVLTPLPKALGEGHVSAVHMVSAAIVFVMFTAICIRTAVHDKRNPMLRPADGTVGSAVWRAPRMLLARISNRISWKFHAFCGGFIVLGGLFLACAHLFHLVLPLHFGPLWVTEVLAILFFSASWFAKGLDDLFWRREPWSRELASKIRQDIVSGQQ